MPYFSIYNVESAKTEIDALAEAENELMMIEDNLKEAERVHFFYLLIYSHCFSSFVGSSSKFTYMILVQVKKHYEGIMHTKVLADLKNAEAEYLELEHSCQVQ